jgi:hypothetical protein
MMFIGFFRVYARLRRLEANVTQLVRHLAIQNAVIAAPPRRDGGQGER